jgi:hypothetical protein
MRHLEEHKRIVPADDADCTRAVREDDALALRDRGFANRDAR